MLMEIEGLDYVDHYELTTNNIENKTKFHKRIMEDGHIMLYFSKSYGEWPIDRNQRVNEEYVV